MTHDPSYRLYLEEKFAGMQTAQHAYFGEVHTKLDIIQDQVTKTNGRVTDLEEKCRDIDSDLEEYHMVKKYPKIAIGVIAFTVLMFIYGFYKISNKQDVLQKTQDGLKTQVDMINTPMTDERTGKVYLYPSGLLVDSLRKGDSLK